MGLGGDKMTIPYNTKLLRDLKDEE